MTTPLESGPGALSSARDAAVLERMDIDCMRRLTSGELDCLEIQVKLRTISRLLDDLASLGKIDPARLKQDRRLLAAERLLTLVVDLAVSINSHVCANELGWIADTYGESFPLAARTNLIDGTLAAELAPSVGLRNGLIYDPVAIDSQQVVGAIPTTINLYGRYVQQVSRWLTDLRS